MSKWCPYSHMQLQYGHVHTNGHVILLMLNRLFKTKTIALLNVFANENKTAQRKTKIKAKKKS